MDGSARVSSRYTGHTWCAICAKQEFECGEKEKRNRREREIKHDVRHVNYTIFTIGFI